MWVTTRGTGVAEGLGEGLVVEALGVSLPKGSQLTLPPKGSQEGRAPCSQVTFPGPPPSMKIVAAMARISEPVAEAIRVRRRPQNRVFDWV